jgi:hypothetical protein
MLLLAGGHDLVHNEDQTINQFARVRLHFALIKSPNKCQTRSQKSKSQQCQNQSQTKNGFEVRCKKLFKCQTIEPAPTL